MAERTLALPSPVSEALFPTNSYHPAQNCTDSELRHRRKPLVRQQQERQDPRPPVREDAALGEMTPPRLRPRASPWSAASREAPRGQRAPSGWARGQPLAEGAPSKDKGRRRASAPPSGGLVCFVFI